MIKIFTPDKTIYLTDNQTLYKKNKSSISIQAVDEMQNKYQDMILNPAAPSELCFYNSNLKSLFEYFSSMFSIIEAAGGLVRNEKGEWLFIFRLGKWDLPKGKIEKGEAIEEAALREVEEECGISGLKIVKELPPTYHTYSLNTKNILKRTYWYEMKTDFSGKLIPQTEEGITDVQWIAAKNIKPVFENTYESIKEVLVNIRQH